MPMDVGHNVAETLVVESHGGADVVDRGGDAGDVVEEGGLPSERQGGKVLGVVLE